MSLLFEWDAAKDRANYQKHRITFAESRTIFNDPFLLTFPDEAHSQNEDRMKTVSLALEQRQTVEFWWLSIQSAARKFA